MVSTRHSVEPTEALVALDMNHTHEVEVVEPTKAPKSKRSRKMDTTATDTPQGSSTDKFEDARDTPFTLRKKRDNSQSHNASPLNKKRRVAVDLRKKSKLAAAPESESDSGLDTSMVQDAFETADEQASSDAESIDGNETESKTISPDLDGTFAHAERRAAGSSEEDSDDDTAPEVVSNKAQASEVKAQELAVASAHKRQQDEAKRKRQARDAALKLQKDMAKASKVEEVKPVDAEEDDEEDASEADEIAQAAAAKPKKVALPRMLPDEILNAAPIATVSPPIDSVDEPATERKSKAVHKRFDKEVTNIKRGNTLVKKLAKQRLDLAPKRNASTANTKHQWLYNRNADLKGRRPLKKPLA